MPNRKSIINKENYGNTNFTTLNNLYENNNSIEFLTESIKILFRYILSNKIRLTKINDTDKTYYMKLIESLKYLIIYCKEYLNFDKSKLTEMNRRRMTPEKYEFIRSMKEYKYNDESKENFHEVLQRINNIINSIISIISETNNTTKLTNENKNNYYDQIESIYNILLNNINENNTNFLKQFIKINCTNLCLFIL